MDVDQPGDPDEMGGPSRLDGFGDRYRLGLYYQEKAMTRLPDRRERHTGLTLCFNAPPMWRCRVFGHKPKLYLQRSFISEMGLKACQRCGKWLVASEGTSP